MQVMIRQVNFLQSIKFVKLMFLAVFIAIMSYMLLVRLWNLKIVGPFLGQ